MAVRATTVLDCTPASVATARAWTNAHMLLLIADKTHRPDLVEDAQLVVSELVTNALQAGCTKYTLELRTDTRRLFITLTDDAGGTPQLQHPDATQTSGRGLAIVDQIAEAWGTETKSDGKIVWAELFVA